MLQIGLDNMALVCGMVLVALTQTDYQVILGLVGVVVQILLVQPVQAIKHEHRLEFKLTDSHIGGESKMVMLIYMETNQAQMIFS